MSYYSDIQKEETLKAAVFRDFFISSKYAYEPNIGNIDFFVTEAKSIKNNIWNRHYLWAKTKKGIADTYSMLTQLVLTIKKTYEKGERLSPPYIACFDTSKISFVPFHDILPIFTDNDVNWNVTQSVHITSDYVKTIKEFVIICSKWLEKVIKSITIEWINNRNNNIFNTYYCIFYKKHNYIFAEKTSK